MKFLYTSTGDKYPPDKHLLDGLKENGHEVFGLIKKTRETEKYSEFLRRFKQETREYDAIFVGYALPLLVPILRLFSRKKIIFNAVSSQYEANIVSRGIARPYSLKASKSWIIDFISFHFSSYVLLESNAQIDFVRKLFFVPKKKLIRSWMGIDENVFFFDPAIKKNTEFTVLFRGRFLPESGILTVIETAKLLEDKSIRFLIIGHGFLYKEVGALKEKLSPKNATFISHTLSPKEIREYMLSSHISLGQLANHPRLSRTLPCKLFESLALKLPYLTGRNAGVLELLKEDETCLAVNPGDANDLAKKILFLKEHPEILQKIEENGYALYKKKLTSKILAEDVAKKIL
jgi:glycosyltransferase involved in cell wall biosynthesis